LAGQTEIIPVPRRPAGRQATGVSSFAKPACRFTRRNGGQAGLRWTGSPSSEAMEEQGIPRGVSMIAG